MYYCGTDCAAKCLFCRWASEGAGLQGGGVVCEVHQQVKACGGWKGLIPPWTQLIGAALRVLSHLKLAPGAETGEKPGGSGNCLLALTHHERQTKSFIYSNHLTAHPLYALVWTCHRVLMTFETEESRSSLEMKLYVMPKKASGLSWAFCFSWITVYTSVMESTAETKTAPHIHVCSRFLQKTGSDTSSASSSEDVNL